MLTQDTINEMWKLAFYLEVIAQIMLKMKWTPAVVIDIMAEVIAQKCNTTKEKAYWPAFNAVMSVL